MIIQFAAVIDGAQETPPNASAAMATGTFTMDTVASTITVNVVVDVPPPSGEIGAHIHGFALPGTPAGVLFTLPLGSPKTAVWNYTRTDTGIISVGYTYVDIHSNAFPDGEIRGQIVRVPSCGDGVLDPGEDSDDGNNLNGDCLDATCHFESEGSPCNIASSFCGNGFCNATGSCITAPRSDCRSALKSSLLMKNGDNESRDKLTWKWLKGAETDFADFGDPTGATDYAFCVYAGTTQIVVDAVIPGGGSPPWSAISTKGYKYSDPSGLPSGIQKVILKSGGPGKAKALLKGKGMNLPDPYQSPLGFELPVTAQLINLSSPVCFESVFDSGDVIKNEAQLFKARTR